MKKVLTICLFLLLVIFAQVQGADDLVVEDESNQINGKKFETVSEKMEKTNAESITEGTCKSRYEGDKTCGADIINGNKINTSANPKSDYYSKKTKAVQKPKEAEVELSDDLKYEELFLQKGHERDEYLKSFEKDSNYTEYFDLSVDPEEMEYIKTQKFVLIPPKKFQFNYQGNFLHFYKIAYEKELPVFFSTDSMLYSLNENIQRISNNFLENVLIILLKKTLENFVDHIEKLKEKPELGEYKYVFSHSQIYFGAGIDLLSSGIENYEGPAEITHLIKGVSDLSKKFTVNTFGIMMKARQINTASMIPIGYWKRSQRLANLFMGLKFYQLVKLDLRDDLKAIYVLGKIIVDSGNKQIFNEIKEMIHYLIGSDKTTPDFVEVYELGRQLGIGEDIYLLSNDQIHELNKKINDLVSDFKTYTIDLPFTNDYFLYSQEQYDKFRYDKEFSTSLFHKENALEDWILNKLLDYGKNPPRLMVSSFEILDAMHHASSYRQIIFNRYQGKPSFRNEQMINFRDDINIQENFEKAKYTIKHSMEREPNRWKNNLKNHYHYLLYKVTRRIKHSSDPIYKSKIYKEKSFQTAWGAYTHFKRQMILLTRSLKVEKVEKGGIPEVVLEPHLEFYKEMKTLWSSFKDRISQYILTAELNLKLNYKLIRAQYTNYFQDVSDAIEICIQGIIKQEAGKLDDEWRNRINKLIFFEKESKTWQGWYTNLYDRDNPNKIFNLDIWISNIASFPEVDKFKFPGINLFNIMKFPQLAYIVVEDKHNKLRKILLTSQFSVKEAYKRMDNQIDSEAMGKEILDRN